MACLNTEMQMPLYSTFFPILQSVVSFFKFFGISDKFIFYGLFSTLGKIRFLADCISHYLCKGLKLLEIKTMKNQIKMYFPFCDLQ